MIRHVVLFKLNQGIDPEDVKTCLDGMRGNVPQLRGIEVGIDVLRSPRSYEIALAVLVDDLAALDAYQHDPFHCDVVKKYMHEVTCGSVACDYEI